MNKNENFDFDEFEEELDDVIDEQPKVERTKRQIFKEWCHDHSDGIIKGVFSGIFGLFGIILSYILNQRENDSYLYTTDQNGNCYRMQAKEMKTSKVTVNEDVVTDKKKKRR